MAKLKLREIPRCPSCGAQMFTRGEVCANCQQKEARKAYNEVVQAEGTLNRGQPNKASGSWAALIVPLLVALFVLVGLLIFSLMN